MTEASSLDLPARPAPAALGHHRERLLERIVGGTSHEAPPLLGGKLRLIRAIGHGGMGTVWEAEHVGLGIHVAVKRLRVDLARDERVRERFIREARSVAAVKHPHVVEILDVCNDAGGEPYLVMELLDGEPLSHTIRRDAPMPWSRTARLLAQLADALRRAHASAVIHRDLKPANIVVLDVGTPHESVKIIDFGLAKVSGPDHAVHGITHTGEVFGSPGYMSPEQLRGQSVDARTDVYALGCVAFEMLTGRPPFPGPTVADVVAQHLTVEPPLPQAIRAEASLVPAIQALLCAALDKDRAQRPADAGAFAQGLESIESRALPRRAWTRVSRYAFPAAAVTTMALVLPQLWGSPSGVEDPPRPASVVDVTVAVDRPLDLATPQWPTGWVGADLGLTAPRPDRSAADRGGPGAAEGFVAVWGFDPGFDTPTRMEMARGDAFRLSHHAIGLGLTLGHAVDDAEAAERIEPPGDATQARTFWQVPDGFPLRAIGSTQVGPGCAGVQVGPVHVLTSASCVVRIGGAPLPDRRWQPADARDSAEGAVAFTRIYVSEQWAQNDRGGYFDWALAITERELGDHYFGVAAIADDALAGLSLHHKGYPLERDVKCDARSPQGWAQGANRLWGNPVGLEPNTAAFRARSPISGWARIMATTAVTSLGHAGGPYYYYDESDRPVVVAIQRSACTDSDGGSAEFCGFAAPWACGAPTALPSQAARLEPEALYGYIVPALTWWGVDDEGRAVCLLPGGC